MKDPALDRNHPAFKPEAAPFFDIVMEGLRDEVDGEHFWDAVAEDAVFEFSYRFPGMKEKMESRAEYMEWFALYPNRLTHADGLKVYRDKEKQVVVLDYVVYGIGPTGNEYRNRFCSIVTVRNRRIVYWVDFADTYSAAMAMQP